MRFWTWAEIKNKLNQDLDLEDETFIQETELLAYANEAIDEAEAEIHSKAEDYFLARGTITLISGTEEYAFPSDIYAAKFRRMVYRNANNWYRVDRVKDWHKFETYEAAAAHLGDTTSNYKFFLLNSTAGSPKVLFTPVPYESGDYIKVWYYRNANRLLDDTSICDIPEFVSFVIQFVKVRCYEKEVGHPSLPMAIQALEAQREQMQTTLGNMVPDADSEIEKDLSHYAEHN